MSVTKGKEGKANGLDQENGTAIGKAVIPESPELMMRLAEKILSVHESKGAESPVGDALAIQIDVKCSLAREKHEEGMASLKAGSKALEARDAYLGIRQPAGGATEVS